MDKTIKCMFKRQHNKVYVIIVNDSPQKYSLYHASMVLLDRFILEKMSKNK